MVSKEVPQLGLALQRVLRQLVALQLVVVQNEPSKPSNVGQHGGGQG